MSEALTDIATFINALAWRLREMKVRAGPTEISQAAAVLSLQTDWRKDDLKRVLVPVFSKRAGHRALIEAAVDELLAKPQQPDIRADDSPRPDTRDEGLPPPPPPWWQAPSYLRSKRTWGVAVVCVGLVYAVLNWDSIGPLIHFILNYIIGFFQGDDGQCEFCKDDTIRKTVGIGWPELASAVVASGVVALIVALGKKFSRRGVILVSTVRNIRELAGDGSSFRVGALGGPPPPFLSRHLAADIAELLAYRRTAPDERELDLRSTIDRHAQGEREAIVYEKRKELPAVLILNDVLSDARYWNTIVAEFADALTRRGVHVQIFDFAGTLSSINRLGGDHSTPVSTLLELAAGASAWNLTVVFGDLRQLSPRDVTFLAGLNEHGPVLAFDYNDPRTWDNRQHAMQNRGVPVYPATGSSLQRALATVFAPDKSALQGGLASASFDGGGYRGLSIVHTEWASVCATIQPISFSLAEKLRRKHPQIAGDDDGLAFSLLVNLRGSWIGPDGLRFAPDVRRELLSRSESTSRDQQFAFLEVLDEAFATVPAGVTATELWRYTRAQAELFSPRQARATRELRSVKESGLVSRDQIDDFVARLREESDTGGDRGRIIMSRSGQTRKLLGVDRVDGASDEKKALNYVQWSIAVPEARLPLDSSVAESGAKVFAEFLSEGRYILLVEPGTDQPFKLIDTARGSAEEIDSRHSSAELDPRTITAIQGFRWKSTSGILTTRTGRILSFDLGDHAERAGVRALSFREVRVELSSDSPTILMAACEAAPFIAVSEAATQVLLIIEIDGETSRSPQRVDIPGPIVSLAFVSANYVLVGTKAGNVYRVSVGKDGLDKPESQASFEQEIVVLAEAKSDAESDTESDNNRIVAGTSDGRIGPPRRLAGVLSWQPRRLIIFAELSAAMDWNGPVGVSIAVMGINGEFDIVGIELAGDKMESGGESLLDNSIEPARDGISILALSEERRRIATLSGTYLEIRPIVYELPDRPARQQSGDASQSTPENSEAPA